MTKEAVILAAGRGSRLGGEVNGDPKCLIPFGDKALLDQQLSALEAVGIERIVLVVGHEAERVCSLAGDRCICVVNPRYDETNSLYSLWVARRHITGPFMLINSDVLAHPDIYRRVATSGGSMLAYDASSGSEAEHMKVSFSTGKLRAISKTLVANEVDGENVGILHFDRKAAQLLFDEADGIVASGDFKCWAPAALDRIADRVSMRGVNVSDLPWTEIDFPEDLIVARETVWPAIGGAVTPEARNGLPNDTPRGSAERMIRVVGNALRGPSGDISKRRCS